MEPGQTHSRFATTCWTVIAQAGGGDADQFASLLEQYWSPIYAFFRRSGRQRERAKDLTQSFISDVVIGRDLIGRADAERGRFRAYLITALKRFAIDQDRSDEGHVITVADDVLRAIEPSEDDDPIMAYDRQWAATVFHLACIRVEQACVDGGIERTWRAFEARILRPIVSGNDPISFDELAVELGAESRQQIYSMLQTIKEKVQHAVRDVVAETVDDPRLIDREVAELRQFLSF